MGEAGRGLFSLYMRGMSPDAPDDMVDWAWSILSDAQKRGWEAVEDHVLDTGGHLA